MWKKLKIVTITFSFLALLGMVPQLSAQSINDTVFNCNDPEVQKTDFCKGVAQEAGKGDRILGPTGILTVIAQFIVYITATISVIMIIIGGFRYVLSGGDSNAISGAKNTILYAVVGLVVAIFSQVIVTFVLSEL